MAGELAMVLNYLEPNFEQQ
jgi:hypothetical protein